MRSWGICLGCALLALAMFGASAQDPAPSPRIQGPASGPLALPDAGASPGQAQAGPLKFKMYAILGQKKEGSNAPLSEELKPVESILKKLDMNDFQTVAIEHRETPEGVETQFPINAVYSLAVQPVAGGQQGAENIMIRVDMADNGKIVKALSTQAQAKPGDLLVFRGMPLSPGEMIVLLQRDAGDQQNQDGQSQDQEQQQKDQEQKKDGQEQNSPENKEEPEDKQDQKKSEEQKKKEEQQQAAEKKEEQDASDQKDEQQPEEKKDSNALESLLKSLEDTDKKEQAEIRNKRDRIDLKGDWW